MATIKLRDLQPSSTAVGLLIALLAGDLLLLCLHASHVRWDIPDSGLWLISRDRGIPEMYQYIKEAAVVIVALRYRGGRSPVHLAWAATFAYLLIDDSLEVHETLGEFMADLLGFGAVGGVSARDLGQVLVSAAIGGVLLLVLMYVTWVDRTSARKYTRRMLPILVALAFFGIVADVIDVIDVLGLVEDGGEMVTMSMAVYVTVDHVQRFPSSGDEALPATT